MWAAASPSAAAGLGTLDTAVALPVSSPAQQLAGLPTLRAGIEVLPTSAAPPTALAQRGRGKLVWAAAGFLACAAGAGFFLLRGKTGVPSVEKPAPPPRHEIPSRPAPPEMGASVHAAVVDAAALAEQPRREPIASAPAAPPAPRGKHAATAKEESLSPTVAAELDAALASLNEGNVAEAIRKARHSLFEQKTSRAFVILTRAYCTTGDLGAAQASLRNVAASERARVVHACKATGMDL